jgi:hypothetical protein
MFLPNISQQEKLYLFNYRNEYLILNTRSEEKYAPPENPQPNLMEMNKSLKLPIKLHQAKSLDLDPQGPLFEIMTLITQLLGKLENEIYNKNHFIITNDKKSLNLQNLNANLKAEEEVYAKLEMVEAENQIESMLKMVVINSLSRITKHSKEFVLELEVI